jgi:hypothetical protein
MSEVRQTAHCGPHKRHGASTRSLSVQMVPSAGDKEVDGVDHSLRRAVLQRLTAVEEMAVRAGSQLSVRTARSQLRSITSGWREVLIEHQPDLNGRCPVCSGWLRRRRWPCQVWVTAHEHLIGEGQESTPGTAKKPSPFRRSQQLRPRKVRPRQVEVIPRQVEASAAVDQTGATPTSGMSRAAADHPVAEHSRASRPSGRSEGNGATLPGIHRAPLNERTPVTVPGSRRDGRFPA